MKKKNSDRSVIRVLLLVVMILCTLYSLHPAIPLPSILSLRNIMMGFVMVLVLFKCYYRKPFTIKKEDGRYIISLLLLLLYSFLVYYINGVSESGSYVIYSSIFNFLTLVTIFPVFGEKLFRSREELCWAITIAAVLQSAIVVLSFLSPGIRSLILNIQAIDETSADFKSRYLMARNIGFGVAGAGGSVYLFTGFITSCYTFIRRQHVRSSVFAMCIIFVGITLVGRTGFYAAILMLLYILYTKIRTKNGILDVLRMLLIAGIVFIVGLTLLESAGTNELLKTNTFKRLGELFRDGINSVTLHGINNNNFKFSDLNLLEIIFGTGITRGTTTSGVMIQHDSGYVQSLVSIGIVGAVWLYLGFIRYVKLLLAGESKQFVTYIWVCMAILAIIEYKEPFVLKLAYSYTTVMLCRLKSADAPCIEQEGKRNEYCEESGWRRL